MAELIGMALAVAAKRRRGQHSASPLSSATRQRVLTGLLARAEAGDVAAAEALVRPSIERESAAVVQGAASPNACGRCSCLRAGA